jgi:hypothetical protein
MSAFQAEHSRHSHSFTVARPMADTFPLFEPEGERAWAEGWDPLYVHPADGRPCRGMVFTTGHGGEATIWMMIRHEPEAGVVEYLRCTPSSRTGSVLVRCEPLDAARTRVTVTYELTALNETGNAYIREMNETRYRAFIEEWERAIARIR